MSSSINDVQCIIQTPRYKPTDDPLKVYKYIIENNTGYRIDKWINNKIEYFGSYQNLADAVHERDLLESVNWDIDLLVELPYTTPGFSIHDLPPFPKTDNPLLRRMGSKYFGFKGIVLIKPIVNKDRLNKVWRSSIKYNGHNTSLALCNDPLSPSLIYALVKEEIQKVKS